MDKMYDKYFNMQTFGLAFQTADSRESMFCTFSMNYKNQMQLLTQIIPIKKEYPYLSLWQSFYIVNKL